MAIINKKLYDTNLLLIVHSSRLGNKYECHRFREYNIDIDLETDADAFDFVFKNPNSVYTSLFSKFDIVEIYLNNIGVMTGRVDTVAYYWDSGDDYIRVTGRDLAAPLVDNHALPTTLQNIKPRDYIAGKCTYYGISMSSVESMKTISKYIVGVGETEMSIMQKMAVNENKKIWLDYKTLHVGNWSTSVQPSYTFTSGNEIPVDKRCIPILTFSLEDNGTEVYSESIVYGSTSSGENKVVGNSKNNYMYNNKIHKRIAISASNNDGSDVYKATAEDNVRYGFDNSITLQITVRTASTLIKPNTTAWVIDMKTRTNAVFFIKKVTYSKNTTDGSITSITMIPSKASNDYMYSEQGTLAGGITGKAKMSFDDLWNSKKG